MADCVSNAAELVARLRSNPNNVWMTEAADAIEADRMEIAGLRMRRDELYKKIDQLELENARLKAADDIEALMQKAVEDDATIVLIRKKAEDEIEALLIENARLKRERDAAVKDLEDFSDSESSCFYCRKFSSVGCTECKWEWRGVQKEENDVSKT